MTKEIEFQNKIDDLVNPETSEQLIQWLKRSKVEHTYYNAVEMQLANRSRK